MRADNDDGKPQRRDREPFLVIGRAVHEPQCIMLKVIGRGNEPSEGLLDDRELDEYPSVTSDSNPSEIFLDEHSATPTHTPSDTDSDGPTQDGYPGDAAWHTYPGYFASGRTNSNPEGVYGPCGSFPTFPEPYASPYPTGLDPLGYGPPSMPGYRPSGFIPLEPRPLYTGSRDSNARNYTWSALDGGLGST